MADFREGRKQRTLLQNCHLADFKNTLPPTSLIFNLLCNAYFGIKNGTDVVYGRQITQFFSYYLMTLQVHEKIS